MKELTLHTIQDNLSDYADEADSLKNETAWARSSVMRRILNAVERLSPTRTAVLLVGESGSGKGWIAQLLHQKGKRPGLILSLPCANLGMERLESAPYGSTIVLQDIELLPKSAQSQLTLLLDEIDPPNSLNVNPKEVPDFRIVATTTQDPARSIQQGALLPELYYRMAAAEFYIPPLRERKEDIEALVAIFLSEFEQKYDLGPFVVTDAFLEALSQASWPGNIQQLRAVLEKIILQSTQDVLDLETLSQSCIALFGASSFEVRIGTSLADVEKQLILKTILAFGGRRIQAASALGISRRKLHYKLRQYREDGLPI